MDHITWRHRAAIAILAFATFAPTLHVGFLWDDHMIIEQNPWIRQWDARSLTHDFRSDNTQGTGDDYYRPLQAVVNRIDYTTWGLRPFGFHLSNIFFHIAACWLFLEFAITLGLIPMAAFLATCLFAVHPAAIEQFLSAAGRTTMLCFCWTILSLLALRREGRWFTVGGVLAYAAALFTKESGIAVPLLVVLTFWYWRLPLRRYIAALVPMAFVTIFYLMLRSHAVAPLAPYSPSVVCLFFTHVFPRIMVHYVTMILWPWNLHSHRLIPHLTHAWPLYLLGWAALGFYAWKSGRRLVLFCIGWLLISLLPVTLTMIPGGFMIDHWAYAASPAVFIPLGLLFSYGWDRHHERLGQALCILFFFFIVFWALLVALNVQLRDTDEKMFRWALHFTTSRPILSNLGVVLLKQGRPGEAIEYLDDVHQDYPEDSNNSNALAEAYWAIGDKAKALGVLNEMIALKPTDPLTLRNLESMRSSHSIRSNHDKPLEYSPNQQ